MTVQDLVEFELIRLLKHRYMRALDTKDWALMRSLFAEDAYCWFDEGAASRSGRDAIIEMFETTVLPSLVSSHIAVHPEIELTGEESATALWRLEDTVHFTASNALVTHKAVSARDELQGAGYYKDEYVKIAGEWKIKSTGYVRIYERIESIGQRVLHFSPNVSVKEKLTSNPNG